MCSRDDSVMLLDDGSPILQDDYAAFMTNQKDFIRSFRCAMFKSGIRFIQYYNLNLIETKIELLL